MNGAAKLDEGLITTPDQKELPDRRYGVRDQRGDFEPLINASSAADRLYLRCRRANSKPDPDLRYFSNLVARASSPNFTTTSTAHGRYFAVCGQRPPGLTDAQWNVLRDAGPDIRGEFRALGLGTFARLIRIYRGAQRTLMIGAQQPGELEWAADCRQEDTT